MWVTHITSTLCVQQKNQGTLRGYITAPLKAIASSDFRGATSSKGPQRFLVACWALLEAAGNSRGHQGAVIMELRLLTKWCSGSMLSEGGLLQGGAELLRAGLNEIEQNT